MRLQFFVDNVFFSKYFKTPFSQNTLAGLLMQKISFFNSWKLPRKTFKNRAILIVLCLIYIIVLIITLNLIITSFLGDWRSGEGSRTAATSKMELFKTIAKGSQPLITTDTTTILGVTAGPNLHVLGTMNSLRKTNFPK